MEVLRRFLDTAPTQRDFRQDKPTLLVSWFCTFYAITVILFRAGGRYVRAEKVFLEDGVMLLAIIPLLARMAIVHAVLLFGTHNVDITGLSALDIHHRELGSKLVLAARIMYAGYLWMIKYSVSIYLRTLTESIWQRAHQKTLRYLHIFLGLSIIGVIISDLAECQPFTHYWQVTPDPGSQCRQGYAQLLTFGILNILTNIALALFPAPMILKSRLDSKRKTHIILRLALPLIPLLLTIYQIPAVISHLGSQQFRSLVASFDILLSTFAANAVVLTSLLQDRGYKKTKYKHGDARSGFNVRGGKRIGWGSDEDLIRGNKGGVVIGMEDLGLEGEGRKGYGGMPKARFSEIRVASTWEVVDKA